MTARHIYVKIYTYVHQQYIRHCDLTHVSMRNICDSRKYGESFIISVSEKYSTRSVPLQFDNKSLKYVNIVKNSNDQHDAK